jgi:MFS family permease
VRVRHLLITLAAGLALADASVVTLALPDLLVDLHTTVEGVAAVIGVYTVVLALALIPAERAMRRIGPGRTGAVGLTLFAVASLVCAASNSLPLLLPPLSLSTPPAPPPRSSRRLPSSLRTPAPAASGWRPPCSRARSARRWAAR